MLRDSGNALDRTKLAAAPLLQVDKVVATVGSIVLRSKEFSRQIRDFRKWHLKTHLILSVPVYGLYDCGKIGLVEGGNPVAGGKLLAELGVVRHLFTGGNGAEVNHGLAVCPGKHII
jgi:hypothetical protein